MDILMKTGGKAESVPVGLLWGGLTSLLVTLVMSALISWMVLTQKLGEDQIGYGVMGILTSASFLGAKMSYRKIKRQRLAVSFLAGAIYFLILLCMTALFFGGQYSGVGETALMVLCGAGLAALIHSSSNSGRKNGRRGNGYR